MTQETMRHSRECPKGRPVPTDGVHERRYDEPTLLVATVWRAWCCHSRVQAQHQGRALGAAEARGATLDPVHHVPCLAPRRGIRQSGEQMLGRQPAQHSTREER